MTYAKVRARADRLEQFLDEYGSVIENALRVYAEKYREEAKPLRARYEEIKGDEAKRAEQDATWITTSGLKHMAGLFSETADRAERAMEKLRELEEGEDDDD